MELRKGEGRGGRGKKGGMGGEGDGCPLKIPKYAIEQLIGCN